jgi:hypothetical protein
MHVGFHTATISWLHMGDLAADLEDFNAELMSGNTGIAEKRHFAQVAGKVRAAYPNAMYLDKCLMGLG